MQVLIIEDDECDFELIRRTFEKAFTGTELAFDWQAQPDLHDLRDCIDRYDICMVDNGLAGQSGTELIRGLNAAGAQTPMILLTGDLRPDLDQEALLAGASDFLHKDKISATSLSRAARYCIARKDQEKRLRDMAFTDALTGLANRAAFDERCQAALARLRTKGRHLSLVLLDLDDFKAVNDTYGHAYGDELLRLFAENLRGLVEPQHMVARLGGDEFGIVMETPNDPGSTAMMRRNVRQHLGTHFHVFEKLLEAQGSIGVTTVSHDQCDISPTELLSRADRSLYCDKNRRKFEQSHQEKTLRLSDIDIEMVVRRLERAVEQDEFDLSFQPKLSVGSGRITGAEALLRWASPDFQMGPDAFIPIAEDYGLIRDIGAWVIRACCQQIRAWIDQGLEPVPVAVNVSPVQLEDLNFFEIVKQALDAFQITGDLLEFEVTEGAFSRSAANRTQQMHRIAELGCTWAIDDFGIGYSSLSRLHELPVSIIKIDRSFLDRLPQDQAARDISNAIISMARNLKMRVVAEGVERPSQLDGLMFSPTDELQGYHCHPPLTAASMTDLLAPVPQRRWVN